MSDTRETVRLEYNRIETAAALIARAFHDDPVAVYMIPDADERARSLPTHFAVIVRLGVLFGEVHTMRDPLRGAAVWFGPGAWELSPDQLARAGAMELEEKLPAGAFARFLTVTETMERLHKRDASDPHWYLSLLAVDPDFQRRGLGGALLQPMLVRADAQRLPCYLETGEPTNGPFYERHGFEVIVEGTEPSSGLRYWTYRRPPGGASR